jgi:hypothetical protein
LVALDRLRDTTSVEPILAVAVHAQSPDVLRREAAHALSGYRSIVVWRRLIDAAVQAPALRFAVVSTADSVALGDSVITRLVGDWALTLLDGPPEEYQLQSVVGVAVRLRPREAVASLVRLLSTYEGAVPLAAQQLVRLTGVENAPLVDLWSLDGRQVTQEFWSAWWSANAASYDVVSPDVGKRVFDIWFQGMVRARQLGRSRRGGSRG